MPIQIRTSGDTGQSMPRMVTVLMSGYGKCSIRGKSQRTRINGTEYKSAVYWGIVMEEEYKKALEQISRKNLW